MPSEQPGQNKQPRILHPYATLIPYGPNDKKVTKIVVGIFTGEDKGASSSVALKRWFGTKVLEDKRVLAEVRVLLKAHHVRTLLPAPLIMGCPHEEGDDYPKGEDCSICVFWKGRQGSGATLDTPWMKIEKREPISFRWPKTFRPEMLIE